MARKTEQDDSADPGGFHEASVSRPGTADPLSPLKPGLLPDIAAEESSQTDSDDETGKPPTGTKP